jgi:hypothetical protein
MALRTLRVRAFGRRTLLAFIGCAVLLASGCGGDPESSPASEPGTSVATTDTGSASSGEAVSGLYEVGGHRLFLQCTGRGSPTVVLQHVGRSDSPRGHVSARESVADLHELLAAADVDPPYVLVSFPSPASSGSCTPAPILRTSRLSSVDAGLPLEAKLDPPSRRNEVNAEMNANPENIDAYGAYAEAAALLDKLPAVPFTFMYGTQQDLPEGWGGGAYDRELAEFMESLPQGRLVKLGTGHEIPSEAPQKIAAEIRRLLDEGEAE